MKDFLHIGSSACRVSTAGSGNLAGGAGVSAPNVARPEVTTMRRQIALLLAGLPLRPRARLGRSRRRARPAAAATAARARARQSRPRPTPRSIKIDGCTFAPTVARVPAGTEVQFLNSSIAFHDIVGRDRAWGTEGLDPGEQYSHRFQDAGVYPFSCSLHPGMAGVIVVGRRPSRSMTRRRWPRSNRPRRLRATGDTTVPIVASPGSPSWRARRSERSGSARSPVANATA